MASAQKKRTGIFFDLDGTLTDPSEGFVASLNHALAKMGFEHRLPDELKPYIGPPLRGTLAELLDTDRTDRIEEAVDHYRDRLVSGGLTEAFVHDGIPSVLADLQVDHTLAIATGKPTHQARDVADHFELRHHFADVFGTELDGSYSDKADLLSNALEVLELIGEDCVMIGDTVYDMLGAKANGLLAIGVLWGFGTKEDLVDAGADVVVDSPAEIIAAIR